MLQFWDGARRISNGPTCRVSRCNKRPNLMIPDVNTCGHYCTHRRKYGLNVLWKSRALRRCRAGSNVKTHWGPERFHITLFVACNGIRTGVRRCYSEMPYQVISLQRHCVRRKILQNAPDNSSIEKNAPYKKCSRQKHQRTLFPSHVVSTIESHFNDVFLFPKERDRYCEPVDLVQRI